MAREYSGRSDPQVILRLLWRREPRERARGPKPSLSVDRVVEAAVALADAEGLDALSMRRVAQSLGVGTMSLYRYVPAKSELLDLMADHVLGEQPPPDPALPWRAQLEHYVREGLLLYRRHPWMLQISFARPVLGPNTIGCWNDMLESLRDTGMRPAEVVAATTVLGAYLRGAAEQVVDAARVAADTGESDEAWWGQRQPFWDEIFDEGRYAGITRAWHGGAFDEPEDPFEFGLARLLDGLEAYVATAAKRSGSNGEGSTTGSSPQ